MIDGVVPGHARPVAMVCVGEKGFLTARLTVETPPCHAACPPRETAIGILARALSNLEVNISHQGVCYSCTHPEGTAVLCALRPPRRA